jgi:DNA polymerase-1
MNNSIILIDAYSQIFRAFYAIRALTDSKGRPVNALLIFTRLLLNIERDYPSSLGAMLFDCGKVDFRMKLNPEYKANRPPMPEDLKVQIPILKEMALAFGWPQLSKENYEADDLIGAIAKNITDKAIKIISSDKDLCQLINDNVHMLSPSAKIGFEERNIDYVIKKYNITPSLIRDYLAIVGDNSDNIPGVNGIGPKGAAELLNTCGPIATWIDNITSLPPKFVKKLTGNEELLKKNIRLVSLREDLPEEFNDIYKYLAKGSPDWEKIANLCREYNLNSILKELPEEYRSIPASFIEEKVYEEKSPKETLTEDNDDSFDSLDLFAAAKEQQKNEDKTSPKEENDNNQSDLIQCELF